MLEKLQKIASFLEVKYLSSYAVDVDDPKSYIERSIKRALMALGAGAPPLDIVDALMNDGLSAEEAFLVLHSAKILLEDES